MKIIKSILLLSVLSLWVTAARANITPQMAQTIANTVNGAYGTAPTTSASQFDLSNTNYSSLTGYANAGANPDYGQSQKAVINAICAFGASMDNTSWSDIKGALLSGLPMQGSGTSTKPSSGAVTGTAQGQTQVGMISAWIVIPTLINVFASMDIYIQNFFGGMVYFALFLVMLVFMGIAILKQIHEGKLDLFSWLSRSVLCAIVMLQANMLCNYVLAIALSLAAMINSTLIHGITSSQGMGQWYIKIYGPDILQKAHAIIASNQQNYLGKAFSTSYDNLNLQNYLFNENGQETTADICQYLGGPQAYNAAIAAGGDQTKGFPLAQIEATWCLMSVYNIGMENIKAHLAMAGGGGSSSVDTTNFQVAIAQIYLQDVSITASDTAKIQQMDSALNLGDGGQYAYLKTLSATGDHGATTALGNYTEPKGPTMAVAGVVSAISSNTSVLGTLSGWLAGTLKWVKDKVDILPNFLEGILTVLINGTLQVILMAGLFFWIILAIGLCKIGCVMVILMSPTVILPSMEKHFWTAVKVMVYPSIYPAALIIVMQLDAALASWFGTISGTMAVGLIFNVVPLLFGIVAVFMLPVIVKKVMQGGNVFMAQMGGVKTAAMITAAAVTGGAAAAAIGSKAAVAKGAAGAMGSGGGGGGSGSGGGGGGADHSGLAKQWTGGPGGPTQKAMANTAGVGSTGAGGVFNRASAAMGAVGGGIKHAAGAVGGKIGSVMNAPVPGTKTGTVKGMMAAAALGNIPGMAGYALYARHRGRGKGAQTSSQPTPEVGSLRMSPSGNAPAAQTSSAMPTAPAQTAMRSRLP